MQENATPLTPRDGKRREHTRGALTFLIQKSMFFLSIPMLRCAPLSVSTRPPLGPHARCTHEQRHERKHAARVRPTSKRPPSATRVRLDAPPNFSTLFFSFPRFRLRFLQAFVFIENSFARHGALHSNARVSVHDAHRHGAAKECKKTPRPSRRETEKGANTPAALSLF